MWGNGVCLCVLVHVFFPFAFLHFSVCLAGLINEKLQKWDRENLPQPWDALRKSHTFCLNSNIRVAFLICQLYHYSFRKALMNALLPMTVSYTTSIEVCTRECAFAIVFFFLILYTQMHVYPTVTMCKAVGLLYLPLYVLANYCQNFVAVLVTVHT